MLSSKMNMEYEGKFCKFLDFYPEYTADAVICLQEELQAQVIGKTNLDEFGMGSFGIHSAFGPCRHPQQSTCSQEDYRVAGGSSSGSAAVIHSGLADL